MVTKAVKTNTIPYRGVAVQIRWKILTNNLHIKVKTHFFPVFSFERPPPPLPKTQRKKIKRKFLEL